MRQRSNPNRSTWPVRVRVVSLTVAALLIGSGMSEAIGQNHPKYTARPAETGLVERSANFFVHALDSGSVLHDAVEIRSFADDPTSFEVYAADMVESSSGSLSPAARTAVVSGPGAWISMSSDTVVVSPRSTEVVDFTIEVPFGTLPGEYRAAIMVEASDPIGASSITARTRLGLPVIITVLAEVNLGASLADLDIRHTAEGLRIAVVVTNTGDVTFSYSGLVEAEGWGGGTTVVSQLEPSDVFVAPGDSVRLLGLWTDPPWLGRYDVTAMVTAVVGEHQLAQFSSNPATVWFIPWSAIIVAMAMAAVAIWVWTATRSSRKQWLVRRREERAHLKEYREGRSTSGG